MTENKTVNSNTKELLQTVSFGERRELNVPDGQQIICVTAKSRVSSVEALNNELRINVNTEFTAICRNSEGGFETVKVSAENARSVVKEGIKPSTRAVVDANVTDCEFTQSGGGTATATVEISGWFLKENVLEYLNSELENIHCRTSGVQVENIAVLKDSGLTLTHSNEARMPVKKILDCLDCVTVNNIYPSAGVFQIEGELITRIAAITDNNQFLTQTFSHPFSTEIGEEFCRADSTVDVQATVIKSEVTLSDGDERILITDTEISFRYSVLESLEISGVTDCYSVTNELALASSTATLDKCFCYRTVRDKAASVLKADGVINEIGCVINPMLVTAEASFDECLKVEGLICATVIYYDENNSCVSKQAEIPFVTEVSKDYECSSSLTPSVCITNVSARLRTGTEMEITAEFTVTVRGVSESETTLISSVEVGAEKEENEYAISLYIVKPGEALWDVAKALNSDEETLLKLNSDLTTPLKGGEKILLYKELTFEI